MRNNWEFCWPFGSHGAWCLLCWCPCPTVGHPRHATALLRIWEGEWLKCYMISCEKGVKMGSILCRSGLGQAASEAKLSAIQNTAAYVCCCSRYAHSMNVFRSSTPLHVNLNGDNAVPTEFEWWFQCWFHQPATSIFI